MTTKKDYYKILDIEKKATNEQIKKQYRTLAMKYHPDKGGDPEKFKDISEAYEILSNPEKRSQYDNPHSNFQFNGGSINPDEIFRAFFGANGPPGFTMHHGFGIHPSQVHVVNIGSNINMTSKSTNIYTRGNIRVQETTEIRNGVKTETVTETNMNTGETTHRMRQIK